ncbi:MAG: urease accessory protein UreE [Hydrogenophaga sp.]|uniref:urease accessory protein UreE n=1 Tax=Hydrogenophaga sp. TaxID=1904254 RepID=UPI003D9AC3B0
MLQVSILVPQCKGLAPVLVRRAASVTLDWDVRQKSRFDTESSDGRRVGVFLPRGTVVRGGDVLLTQDGSLLRVIAAAQPVLKITACTDHHHGHEHAQAHDPAFDLMRAAYHLGNRHVPIELRPDHLKIEPDHVLADMLRAMHLTVVEVREPFEPEGGAYAPGHGGGHAHAHDDGHDHARGHDHGPHAHAHG